MYAVYIFPGMKCESRCREIHRELNRFILNEINTLVSFYAKYLWQER